MFVRFRNDWYAPTGETNVRGGRGPQHVSGHHFYAINGVQEVPDWMKPFLPSSAKIVEDALPIALQPGTPGYISSPIMPLGEKFNAEDEKLKQHLEQFQPRKQVTMAEARGFSEPTVHDMLEDTAKSVVNTPPVTRRRAVPAA